AQPGTEGDFMFRKSARLSAVFACLIVAWTKFAFASVPRSDDRALVRQIETRISSVLAAQATALTREEWIRSGLVPESVTALARSLPESSSALCRTFLGMSGEHLAVFEGALKSNTDLLPASCLNRLLVRIRLHWRVQRERLDDYVDSRKDSAESPFKASRLHPFEVRVQAASGPIFFKG